MLFYVLQIILIQAVFLLFYDYFLRRESFFNWNRWYLLATAILSFVLPLIKINWFEKNVITETLQPVIIGSQSIQTQLARQASSGYNHYLLIAYLAGVVIMTALLINKLYQIIRLIKTHKIIDNSQGAKIVLLQNRREAFSFIHYIFIDEQLYQNNDLPVLQHELVHYREKHWLDLLVFEIFKILFWFNPLIWLYQKRLNAVHEFIADKQVLKQNNFGDYFHRLLQEHFDSRQISFINQFYKPSILKTRIMIQKKKTSKSQTVLRYLTSGLILTAMILIVNACNSNTTDKQPEVVTDKPVKNTVTDMKTADKIHVIVSDNRKSGDVNDVSVDNEDVEVAFQFIKHPPVYPGCEGKSGQELKDCISENIRKFVNEKFNKDLAKTLNLEIGQRVKIISQFVVDKNGKVGQVRARSKYPVFENEAKRVIALLPRMKPGIQNKKPVAVRYTLPIIFNVEE